MRSQIRRAALAALSVAVLLPAAGASSAWAGAPGKHDAAGPAPAVARAATGPGTIVFIREHNVWIAAGDGSGARQLTSDGTATTPYGSPSQSDTGKIAAAHGPHIVVLDQHGTVLNRMDPPALMNSVSHPVDGPVVQSAISPNGELVAYTFSNYTCPIGAPCDARRATAITRTDQLIPASTYGQTFYWAPSWVGNTRTIQSGGYLNHVRFKDLGQEPVQWFDDQDIYGQGNSTDLEDLELSDDGRFLAGVRGYGDSTRIIWYRVEGNALSGPPPADPKPLCWTSTLAGLSSPTFAPDSSALAWMEPGDGIWSVDPRDESCTAPPAKLIDNAAEPHWSAAPLSAPKPPPSTSNPPHTSFTVKKKPKVAGVARVGKVLRAKPGSWSPKPAAFSYRWLRNGKPIAKATKPRYKLTRADRGRKIQVRVTARGGGLTAKATLSKAVTVRR